MRIHLGIAQDHSTYTLKHVLSCSMVPLFYCSFALSLFGSPVAAANDRVCIIITGLGGMPEYEENFLSWGSQTETVFRDELNSVVYHLDGRQQKRPDILRIFNEVSSSVPLDEVWLFLIGHASHDNRRYKFNISGPDLTDEDIKTFLDSLGNTRVFLIAATSASGILAPELSRENRVIVTATKNQFEKQPPLFMSFFLEAVTSAKADRDKSGKVSLLEAYLFSHQKVADWFKEKGRIQTEHSLLEDNGRVRLGDKQGTLEENPSSGATLLASMVYLSPPLERVYSSREAEQLASQRVQIEREIEDLKFRKNQLLEDEYYRILEELLVKLATMSQRIEELEREP